MKITGYRILKTKKEIENWLFLIVETNEGICGYGELTCNPLITTSVSSILSEYLDTIIGCNPLDNEGCLQNITKWKYPCFLDNMVVTLVISGIDQALYDIRAKHERKPLYELLNGVNTSIPIYANINRSIRNDRSIEKLIHNVSAAKESGIEYIKIAPFDNITPHDDNPIEQIHQAIEKIDAVGKIYKLSKVMIDCHQKFSFKAASIMLQQLEIKNMEFFCIEDIFSYHYKKTEKLERLKEKYPYIRWAAGEICTTKDHLDELLESKVYTMFNPDIKFIGGVRPLVDIIPEYESLGMLVSIHNPTGPISTAFCAHIMSISTLQTVQEFPFGNQESRDLVLGEEETVRNGTYNLSTENGIGVEINEEFINKYCKVFVKSKWSD